MKQFKWNKHKSTNYFWDVEYAGGKGREVAKILTDADLIKNSGQGKFEDILRALCHVVAELVEIEEARNMESSNPPEDVL